MNGSGSLRVRISRTGEGTMLAGIMRLVQEALTSRTRVQALADRAAYWLTFVAVGMALLALVAWIAVRGFGDYTLERVVTTLVVACPHALGLAIPLVVAISTTLSARSGILVRDPLALAAFALADVIRPESRAAVAALQSQGLRVVTLCRASYRKMMQNLAWAVGYNVIALPIAAGVLAPLGIVMPAAVGAVLMSVSTIIVAVNAQTLRGLDLRAAAPVTTSPQPVAA